MIDDALRPPVLTLSAGSTTPTSASFRRWATFTRRPEDVFRPLFEALSWAVVLGKVGRSGRASREERAVIRGLGEDLLALELARNRSQHQWLSALKVSDVRNSGAGIIVAGRGRPQVIRPVSVQAWVWRKLTDLPGGDSRKGAEEAYVSLLEGQQARIVLDRISAQLTSLR